ncbi:MAG: GIY-YIG nuclease family protein [Saprospiraceae bacterium]
MHYIYMLKSELDGSFYIGYSTDIKRRLAEHNAGLSSYSSGNRKALPLKKQKNRETLAADFPLEKINIAPWHGPECSGRVRFEALHLYAEKVGWPISALRRSTTPVSRLIRWKLIYWEEFEDKKTKKPGILPDARGRFSAGKNQ